jgi:hypothetical protein
MLVATRDPMPPHGRPDAAISRAAHGARIGGFMFVLQLTGSLLAIPVGLASAYSIYRANFSPETTCQSLRNNIIGMIDKQIDATTRRMLVRKDVEMFEKTCGSVDPDAEAAFKSLLASDAAPALRPATAAFDSMPAPEWRKAETAKPLKESKGKDAKEQKEPERVVARIEAHETSPDARWLNAVRSALTAHETERAAQQATVKPLAAPVSLRNEATMDPPIQIAPDLPPPSSIAAPAAAAARPNDHPVPPAAIPDKEPEPATTGSLPPRTSWLDHLPLVGR